jgi:hypothetical protein
MKLIPIPIDGGCGLMNIHGELVFKSKFESLSECGENRIKFEQNRKYGLMTFTGEIICAAQFDRIFQFQDGLAKVENSGLGGFINMAGELVVPCRFYSAGNFSSGLAPVKETMLSKHGYIEGGGSYRIQPKFFDACPFFEGLAVVRIDVPGKIGPQGYINPTGDFVIEPKYQLAHRFSENLAAVSADNSATRFGFIDPTGILKIGPHFAGADLQFSEELAAVWNNGKFGFINHVGDLTIPYQFYNAGHFSCGLSCAKAEEKGKTGFIDKTGEWQIPPQYFIATDFRDDLAHVSIGDTRKQHVRGFINTKGKFIRKWNEN